MTSQAVNSINKCMRIYVIAASRYCEKNFTCTIILLRFYFQLFAYAKFESKSFRPPNSQFHLKSNN